MSESRNLRIGVPSKGWLQQPAEELLHQSGLTFRRQERTLFARCQEVPLDVMFVRAQDIPVLVAEGALDLGSTGCGAAGAGVWEVPAGDLCAGAEPVPGAG